MSFEELSISVGGGSRHTDRDEEVARIQYELADGLKNETEQSSANEQKAERVAVDVRHHVRKWLLGLAVAAGIASLAALLTEKNNVAEALAATSGATLGVAGISKLGRKEDET